MTKLEILKKTEKNRILAEKLAKIEKVKQIVIDALGEELADGCIIEHTDNDEPNPIVTFPGYYPIGILRLTSNKLTTYTFMVYGEVYENFGSALIAAEKKESGGFSKVIGFFESLFCKIINIFT